MDSINEDSCEEKGILILKGKIEGGDVTEDLKIDLPFSYPTSSIKCDINKVNTNQEIETNNSNIFQKCWCNRTKNIKKEEQRIINCKRSSH